jgi:spoIIIJ-associated protein
MTGRTVEEAKDAALDELGVDEADAEFEILEEPRQGLFGRQRGEARVRARVRPTAPRPKVERRDRKRRTPASREAGAATGAAPSASATPPPGRGARKAPASQGGRPKDDERATGREGADMTEELSMAEQGDVARQFVVGLLDRLQMPAQVNTVEVDEDTVEVQVTGQELGLLIGPKGLTLSALQELTRTVVQRRSVGRSGRVVVDVAGYRQRRREALERFTREVAADVVSSGMQKVLEPMSAADRKVVHDTATDIEGVQTSSEGEEPRRRVVIQPVSPANDA